MKTTHKINSRILWLTTILMSTLLAGCDLDNESSTPETPPPVISTPTVSSVIPVDTATDVLIGTTLTATFSEEMDAATLNAQSFTLLADSDAVAGTVSLDGASNTATFTPDNELSANTLYTVTITSDVSSAAGVALASNSAWSFTTAAAIVIADTTAPTIVSNLPANGVTDIALNSTISVDFSEALDPASVNSTSFTVSNGNTAVAGVVSYAGTTASFTPNDELAASTVYTVTLTTAIKDLATASNTLANDYVWSFTSGLSTPVITLTNPLDAEIDVAINHNVVATFSEPMDILTIDTSSFTLTAPNSVAIMGTVSLDVDSNTAVFLPNSELSSDTNYIVTITTAAMSSAGMALASDYIWSFTTVPASDATAPTVMSTNPLDGAIDFPLNRNLVVEFSEGLAPSSVNSSSFIVTDGITSVAGAVVYAGTSVTFNPTNDLAANTLYTATLTTDITDLATPANPLATDYVWSFTTDAVVAAGPAPVNLRTAGNFVILTKTGTTNVHTSAITGNLGASPITAAAMDNVFCTEITGTVFGSDAAYTGSGDVSCFAGAAADNTLVANAVLDMGTAYNDAAGRSLPDFTELHAGDISGQTLVPGLYKWGTNVLINTDVTLSGGANDVWIFQIAGDVIQASATNVFLSGGAQAKNVFWQVGGGAGVSLDTNAHFEGVVLAEKGIAVKTGATVIGRLLSQTAVTLDQNQVTEPAQ
jgi:hypothetical protein